MFIAHCFETLFANVCGSQIMPHKICDTDTSFQVGVKPIVVLPHAERVRGSRLSRPLITNYVWVVYTGSVNYLALVYEYVLMHHIVYWVLRMGAAFAAPARPFVCCWWVRTAQAARRFVILC